MNGKLVITVSLTSLLTISSYLVKPLGHDLSLIASMHAMNSTSVEAMNSTLVIDKATIYCKLAFQTTSFPKTVNI